MPPKLSAKEFDKIKHDMEGVIELNFNGNKCDLFLEDCSFGEERLIRWLT
jgi:hypothetical protein